MLALDIDLYLIAGCASEQKSIRLLVDCTADALSAQFVEFNRAHDRLLGMRQGRNF
jgi:hypothetical protein